MIAASNAMGAFCRGSDSPRMVGDGLVDVGSFDTRQACWASGVALHEGVRYRIRLTTPAEGWIDGCNRGTAAVSIEPVE